MIEYLHVLSDHFLGLFERHILALAAEMRLSVVPTGVAGRAANFLTKAALDPFGKIPEFKYCAVRIEEAILVNA